jgi:hypothetical protein
MRRRFNHHVTEMLHPALSRSRPVDSRWVVEECDLAHERGILIRSSSSSANRRSGPDHPRTKHSARVVADARDALSRNP